MKKFLVSAEFRMGKYPATMNKEVTAENKEMAMEKLLCLIGSKHKTPRRFINILSIAESSKTSVVLDSSDGKSTKELKKQD